MALIIFLVSLFFLLFIISFFRIPNRVLTADDNKIICPADGKVVVIEETVDIEYFKDKRLQVSIFMSPLNVHVTRYPVSGKVKFSKYHPGKFFFSENIFRLQVIHFINQLLKLLKY